MSESSNRLAAETSPYLLQHAGNPVDWYPWGPEALERARREDRPILLSIGYAACHWCHVMERESFEDPETAAYMNEHFVCIKVDREERPDVDAVYMDAVQAMTGHGGWPLTALLTADGAPFFAGTYFPGEPRHGMPSFRQILRAIAEAWRDRRDDLLEQGHRVVEGIAAANSPTGSEEPISGDVLGPAVKALSHSFDRRWGGFGGAPKFPQPTVLEMLLNAHVRGHAGALEMVRRTLDRMAGGGIFDQVGGGFHRYSTDERWHVPHFEKMLYDNAQLARVYTHTWQLTHEGRYREIAERTLDYLLREMRHPEGGFFSSQDADSEGVEGKFFVWSFDEIAGIAGEAVAAALGATPEGNWEGTNVLWMPAAVAGVAGSLGVPEPGPAAEVDAAREALLKARERRVRPATDDKILTAWNALAISAFAEAGRVFGRPEYVDAAGRVADFVLTRLRDGGRLLRSWREGRATVPGYADDHALMAEACLTLYETGFDLRYFRAARDLAEELIRLFLDAEGGGFFQTGADAETLVIRPKELFDNVLPSGNSAAADVLLRLAALTGEERYERAAVSALLLVRDHMLAAPAGFARAIAASDRHLGPSHEVAIAGDPEASDTRALVSEVHSRLRPNMVLALAAPGDEEAPAAIELLRGRATENGRATAYVCERFACSLPVTDPAALADRLGAGTAS